MSNKVKKGATEALAEFACHADVGAGAAALRRYALRSVIDTVAVAIAAAREEPFRIVSATLGSDARQGAAAIWPDGRRGTVEQAALLNGTAAHSLDYDDVAEAIHTHPGAVLVPALLAVADARGASTLEILDAFVIGYEVQSALGRGMDLDVHFGRGWHGTSSIAVLGGAAAVARLLHLDVTATRAAIAISASLAGGSRQNFGTMTKPFHAGIAARDSVIAALLAEAGLTANQTQIEGKLGYLANFGDGPQGADEVVAAITNPWWLLRPALNIKPYPCCYRASRTASAAITLHGDGIDPTQVKDALLTMEPRGTAPLIYSRPTTGLEGKFSAEYVLATGLIDGGVTLPSFTDESVNRPAAQDLLARVRVEEAAVPPFGPPEWEGGFATVVLTLNDGTRVQRRVDVPHGHDDDPLSDEELDQKLRECVSFSGQEIDADALLAQLHGFASDEPFTGLRGLPAQAELSGASR